MARKVIIWMIAIMLILTASCIHMHAAETNGTEKIRFHFRFDKTAVDTSYMSNADSWLKLTKFFERPGKIESIEINVVSSPEGARQRNAYLASERAKAIAEFIITTGEGKIDSTAIRTNITDENWEGLAEAVNLNYHRHDRNKVLDIISTEGISDATREWRLNRLDNGYTWSYLKRKYCPQLREACIVSISFRKEEPIIPIKEVRQTSIEPVETGMTCRHEYFPARQSYKEPQKVSFGLRTNILYDAALTPNIGAEVHFGDGWAVGATWNHAWWSINESHLYWRIYGGEADIRKYFGKQAEERAFSGHHIGIYGQAFTYDLEAGARGVQSKFSYGGGIKYGYSLPVTKSLNIDFELGLGYIGGEYKLYDPEDGCYVWKETRIRHMYGPTKIGVSLVWRIDAGTFVRKGGGR